MKRALIVLGIFATLIVFLGLLPIAIITSDLITPDFYGIFFLITIVITMLIIYWLSSFARDNNQYINNISLNDASEDFKKLYDSLYNNNIGKLEKLRKQVKIRQIIFYILMGIFIIQYIMLDSEIEMIIFSKNIDMIIKLLAFPNAFILMLLGISLSKYKKKYQKQYKDEIIINFIKLLNQNLIYEPEYAKDRIELLYKNVGFENRKYNRVYSDDYISGKIVEGIDLKMVDLHLQNVTESGKNRSIEEIFQGLFAITNCNKSISTPIKITKDKFKFKESDELVKLDSSEFESYFDIYSKDKILALQILTADTMEYLIDFYKKYMLDFDIVIKENNIFMRFHTGAMFEPKIFGSSMEKELLFMYYCVLEFVVELTRKINKTVKEFDE